MRTTEPAANPLSRIALEAPGWVAPACSIGGRLAGAGVALFIVSDQSYDRTQVVAAIIAVVAIGSLVPLPGAAGQVIAALGAGLLFFCGAAFTSEVPAAGAAMMTVAVVATAGLLMASSRHGRTPLWGLAGFFGALPVLVGIVASVALAVEG
jgi:hypothetical protein